ncbi:hypothetical protein ACP4OV_009904 [Aristida adscensionis]
MADDLIPGLPEDLARECLVRLGFEQLPAARRVSRRWKAEVESPFHHRLRHRRRRPLLALAQARPPLAGSGPARKYAASAAASYRLVLHDLDAGTWAAPPPLPGAHDGGLPLFCQLAAVGEGPGRRLVVLGGWDPETWAPTGAVHVYDFLASAWRRGADMRPPRRSFCATCDMPPPPPRRAARRRAGCTWSATGTSWRATSTAAARGDRWLACLKPGAPRRPSWRLVAAAWLSLAPRSTVLSRLCACSARTRRCRHGQQRAEERGKVPKWNRWEAVSVSGGGLSAETCELLQRGHMISVRNAAVLRRSARFREAVARFYRSHANASASS